MLALDGQVTRMQGTGATYHDPAQPRRSRDIGH
ncbi:hypothetical protein DES53_114109 [Roseimicrobium gellanilyticum]|uniref:Uncharacterized protein n=1 Tax=Roseimicrobium gellanilyticum TaxID=748857 RepID=A0A366H7F3_9BACT|nr:hypothetical protein DES53_114109 [Roseimicrobium gellanilyticum]